MTAFEGFPQDAYSFSASDVGHALAGLVQRDEFGVPVPGMLGDAPVVGAGAAAWRVEIGRFVYVHVVAGAVQLSGLSSPEEVDVVSAVGIPAGQARIDLVCWDPVTASLSVVEGTPSTSPVAPSAGGLALVATVRVNSGDSAVVPARVVGVAAVSRPGVAFAHVGKTQGFQGAGVIVMPPAQELVGALTQSGNAIRIGVAGLYQMSAIFHCTGGSNYTAEGYILLNGVNTRRAMTFKPNSSDLTMAASVTKRLAVGDLVSLQQSHGSWGSTGYDGTQLEVLRVG